MRKHSYNYRSMSLFLLCMMWLLISSAATSAPAWYGGTVEYIQPYNGGVGIKFNENKRDDCQNDRVWLKDSVLGEKRVDRLYAMALAAQASGKRIEFVIDKAVNGVNGECVAMGNSLIRS